MKLLIAGSRTFDANKLFRLFDINDLLRYFDLEWPEEFVHGGCPTGADKFCAEIADSYHDTTDCIVFKADWKKYGKSAGPKRNMEMAEYADILILIWDGKSKGSKNMKETMEKLGKPVYEVVLRNSCQDS
jgi:hypothetical protein